MATKRDLMGLGVAPALARQLGSTPVISSCGGGSAGSAIAIGGDQFLTVITASNSGSGVRLPDVGGQGALLGSQPGFVIANAFAAAVQVYANNNAAGSAVTIITRGSAIAGTTGFSLGPNQVAIMYPATVSTWVGISASVA